MSILEENMPIYDERVNEIIRSLSDGITREELAVKYKHRDYKSLDMYMRRRNFRWDSKEKNYKPIATRFSGNKTHEESIHDGKVSRIIKAFEEGKNPKEVAVEVGYKDHKELASYMSNKGYEWNSDLLNYERRVGDVQKDVLDEHSQLESPNVNNERQKGEESTQEIIQLIKTLYEKLNVQVNDPIVDRVPRYLVKGIAKTKSVQMSHYLQQLIEDFSFDKNITQRQIIETAIIDFLRKYGYKHDVDSLLSK